MLAYPTWRFPFGSLKRLKRALQPADLAGCPAVGFYKLAIGENSLLGERIPWVVLQVKLFGFPPQGRLAAFFAPSGAELLEADVLVFLAPPPGWVNAAFVTRSFAIMRSRSLVGRPISRRESPG